MNARTLGEVLSLEGILVISIDGRNIGHTLHREDVSNNDNDFLGVDSIIEFSLKETFIEYKYTFDERALVYVHPSLAPHTYTTYDISGGRVEIQLAIASPIYPTDILKEFI